MHYLEKHWQSVTPVSIALLPLTLLFAFLSWLRASSYRLGLLRAIRCRVPVVVVGNLSVGGTGKTPLVIWLVDALRRRGYSPGVISRGYGGSDDQVAVDTGSSARLAGDEPVLIASRARCPVWVGRDRAAAAEHLLNANPGVDVIVSDDGLQHYRLQRDCELVVVDAQRRFGNGWLLPSGPLRETRSRLHSVDAVVANGGTLADVAVDAYVMHLTGDTFRNVVNPAVGATAAQLRGKRLHAIAGIGYPRRFFAHLRTLGLDFAEHAFPDHHPYTAADLRFADADAVVMTEKDAIKCASFAQDNWWALPVEAEIDEALADLVIRRIGTARGY